MDPLLACRWPAHLRPLAVVFAVTNSDSFLVLVTYSGTAILGSLMFAALLGPVMAFFYACVMALLYALESLVPRTATALWFERKSLHLNRVLGLPAKVWRRMCCVNMCRLSGFCASEAWHMPHCRDRERRHPCLCTEWGCCWEETVM